LEGNKSFNRKNNTEAISHYTKSIAVASNDSEELAIAFTNRSAMFFQLKKYNFCILDIDRALNNYPDTLKSKLFERKGKCFM